MQLRSISFHKLEYVSPELLHNSDYAFGRNVPENTSGGARAVGLVRGRVSFVGMPDHPVLLCSYTVCVVIPR